MKTYKQKFNPGVIILLFLGVLAIFSFFRAATSKYAASLLAMTHEITVSKEHKKTGFSESTIKIVSNKKYAATQGTKAKTTTSSKTSDDRFKNPVTAKLPKTKTPIAVYMDDFPQWNDPRLVMFAPLRKYDGTLWKKEKTEIKASTDGRRVYFLCRFYDQHPEDAITENSRKYGGKNAWQDDSIELFLMKEKNSTHYCQYIVSVSGRGSVYYYKANKDPNSYTADTKPKDFVNPRYDVNDFDGGFEIEMSISLSNIGINKVQPGDSVLLQIVRNYRGQRAKESAGLHLFPVYIYADKRFGLTNHDRRTFQKLVIEKSKSGSL